MHDLDNLKWAVTDAAGRIRATFDSESEARFYLEGRGHVIGGKVLPLMSHEEIPDRSMEKERRDFRERAAAGDPTAIAQSEQEESMENVDEAKKKKWMKDVKIKRPGICTGGKFGGPTCPPGSKQYALAKTFRKAAKGKETKESEELSAQEMVNKLLE